jgi:hypothetical protein
LPFHSSTNAGAHAESINPSSGRTGLDEHQRPDPAGVVEDCATAEKGWRFCFLDLSSRILGGSQGIPLRPQGPQTRSEALFKHVLATSCTPPCRSTTYFESHSSTENAEEPKKLKTL